MGPNGPGNLWKAERIRNLSIVKNLKKAFSLFIFKSLKTRVAAIGPRGCNRFYSGSLTLCELSHFELQKPYLLREFSWAIPFGLIIEIRTDP